MDQESDSNKASIGDDGRQSAPEQNVLHAGKEEIQSVPEGDVQAMDECKPADAKTAVSKDSTMKSTEQELKEAALISPATTSQSTANAMKTDSAGEEVSLISPPNTSQPAADANKTDSVGELQTVPRNDAEQVSASISHKNVKQTADKVCDASNTLNTSLEIVDETSAAANQGEIVVIQSVVQLAPPNAEDLKENTAAAKLQSGLETTSATVEVSSTEVIEEMDIVETVNLNDSFEGEQTRNRTSTNTQKSAEVGHRIPKNAASNSLSLLSQYGSDSDDDDGQNSSESETASVIAVPTTTANKSYRTKVIEIDSDTDTDSSETISSATESGDETEYLTKIAKKINKRIIGHDDDDDDGSDDEDGDNDGKVPKQRGRRKPPHVRGEMLLDELPPIQDLQITVPAEECIEFGRVHSVVDQLLLVSALPNSILLDLDTVLFLERGKRVLGEVFDVLGQVADPMYCVRFNTKEQIHEKGINVGDVVYVAPKTDHTHYVILSSLTKMRGSDASWENDIEPPPRYLDYSDDEEEREARHQLRKQRRMNRENAGNEDDDDDDNDEEDDNVDNKGFDPRKRSRMQIKTEQNTESRRHGRGGFNTGPAGRRNYNASDSNYHRRQPRFDAHSAAPPHNYQPHQNTGSWHSHYNQHQYQQRPPPQHAYRSPYTAPYPYQQQQQRAMYNTPPPPQRSQHFHPYLHRPPMSTVHEQFAPPTGHAMPPPSFSMPPPQMTPPSPHNMPPQPNSPMHSMPPHSPQMSTPPPQSAPVHSMSPMAQPFIMPPQQMLQQQPPMHSMPPPPQQMSQPPPQMVQPSANFVRNPMAAQSPQPKPQLANSIENANEPAPPGAD